MCTEKVRALSYIGAEKFTFPPKSEIMFTRKDKKNSNGVNFSRCNVPWMVEISPSKSLEY